MFFDNCKDSQLKHLTAANEALDSLPIVVNQRSYESRIIKLNNNREKLANQNEKLNQLIEKVYSERALWSRVNHLQ